MLKIAAFLSLGAVAIACAQAPSTAQVGDVAPSFQGETSTGETISLDQFEGKTVVLEWTNDGCPFVQKHYDTGNMQSTQAAVVAAGGVWVSVISSAPGKQGHVSGAQADALTQERNAQPTHIVLDPDGIIGRKYAAKTTPHMFVIDGDGLLRYDGAIDDMPSADHNAVDGATNHVLAAFTSVSNGQEVATAKTKPYGCSVKYGS